jgi:hypothetical protein
MKKLIVVVAMAVGAVGCGLSPTEGCKQIVAVECQRYFECVDATTKASAAFIAVLGTSETECNSKLGSNCATVTDSKPCPDSSKKYDAQKAAACIQDYKAASCPTITGDTFTSGNCSNVCY